MRQAQRKHRFSLVVPGVALAVGVGAGAAQSLATNQVPTTIDDFFGPGTQPATITDAMKSADRCDSCHGHYDAEAEPFTKWAASMMGRALHDPLFQACWAIAEQDAAEVGDLCLRCHTPPGWIEGRSTPTDGSALVASDYDGISCHSCHRMVDPVYSAENPTEDQAILAALTSVQTDPHSGQYVIDPYDRRRGPFDLGNFNKHDWFMSPFHVDSAMCGTCHDVSNPVFFDEGGGVYSVTELGQPHPTSNKYDEFPVERTYSEWTQSAFAQGPIDMGGRFGGNDPLVSSCQDCHQPKTTGKGCKTGDIRTNLPMHDFNGGNTWLLKAIRVIYPDSETYLTEQSVNDSIARAISMIERASDMDLSIEGDQLKVRITNQTGHKLPSGYPEGRRLWLNVQFFDDQDALVEEHGHYDYATATLTTSDTKVYHVELGPDDVVAGVTGIPAEPGFHFAVANKVYMDNRIPPRGFTNANFEAVQAAPVGYSYADGQYWDDTYYDLPSNAVRADVTFYYQTSSKEYIEFLRDENAAPSPNIGETLYDLWADPLVGNMSEPVAADVGAISFTPPPPVCVGDIDGDEDTDVFDFGTLATNFGSSVPAGTGGDLNGDGNVNVFDFGIFAGDFGCMP